MTAFLFESTLTWFAKDLAAAPYLARRKERFDSARERPDHVAPMQPFMVIVVPQQAGPAGVLHIAVSVPRIGCLVDGVKYLEPSDVKPLTDDTEKRRHRHRGPTLRSLVRLARQCDSAEQVGEQLRRRYQRQRQRAGLAPAGRGGADAEAELDRWLGK